MDKLILASSSPRRKELLRRIYPFPFEVIPSSFEESKVIVPYKEDKPYVISYYKGLTISEKHPESYVISCDTLVLIDNKTFGKPHSEDEARKMLFEETESEQKVITGYHFFHNGQDLQSGNAVSTLILHLSEKEIEDYIRTGSPFDKAGGYGIQDLKANQYELRSGTFENVMGFPTDVYKEILLQYHLI